jgi:hypothetical protein
VLPDFTACGRKNRIRKIARRLGLKMNATTSYFSSSFCNLAMQHEDNGFEKDPCHIDIRSSGHGEILEEFEFLVAVRRYRILTASFLHLTRSHASGPLHDVLENTINTGAFAWSSGRSFNRYLEMLSHFAKAGLGFGAVLVLSAGFFPEKVNGLQNGVARLPGLCLISLFSESTSDTLTFS